MLENREKNYYEGERLHFLISKKEDGRELNKREVQEKKLLPANIRLHLAISVAKYETLPPI